MSASKSCKYARRTVYFSKVGNVARLAGKVASLMDLADLPRIASGQSKELASGNTTAGIPTRDSITGLQGVVLK